MDEKYLQKIIENEQSTKSAHHRIDTLEKMLGEIRADVRSTNQIAISVEKLATEMKAMREDEQKMDNRLKQLEDKPVKRHDKVVDLLITRYSNCYTGFFISQNWNVRWYYETSME